MSEKPTYEELEQKVRDLGKEALEHIRTEEALRESEEKYHNLYKLMLLITDNVPDLIWAKDMDDKFLLANQAICDKLLICGSLDKAIGKTEMFFAERERNAGYEHTFGEICVNSDAIIKERKAPGRFLEEGLVRNKYLVLDVHKAPFLNESGEMIGTVGCGRDITKEKETEEALRESDKKYKTLTENSLTGIFIHQDEKFVFVNDRFTEIHGYKPEELLGKEYLTLIHPDEREAVTQRVSERLKGEPSTQQHEVRRFRKDGTTVWCEMMATRIEYRGRPAVMGNIIDITKRKKAEENLKQVNEQLLKEYNQRKILSKRLIDLLERDRHEIAMELHDHIGQILISIKMNLEMLIYESKTANHELVSKIKTIKQKVVETLKEIKNVSYGLRPSMLDTLGLKPSLRELFNDIQRDTDIKIKFFSRNIPKKIVPEKGLAIYRITQEALTNVIKHARAKEVFVNLVKKDEKLSLSIEDDGVGFDPDKAMKVTKRKGPLGLLIMQERAVQLDGEFTVESQIGQGTQVLVEIPI